MRGAGQVARWRREILSKHPQAPRCPLRRALSGDAREALAGQQGVACAGPQAEMPLIWPFSSLLKRAPLGESAFEVWSAV